MTRWLALSLGLTLAAWLVWGYVFWQPDILAEKVPMHWDINMKPDRFADRDGAVIEMALFPGIMLAMVLLTLVLPWLSPKNFKVDSFRNVFHYVMALVVMLMGYVGALVLWAALPDHSMPIRGFLGPFFLFFALMGNVMGKVQRNFWMGVRTPWTLASETVWTRTHRLAAWLWVVVGVLGFVAVLAGAPLWLCFGCLIVAALYPVLYSLIIYKKLERQGKV